jgi:hypothetical protein
VVENLAYEKVEEDTGHHDQEMLNWIPPNLAMQVEEAQLVFLSA